MASFAASLIASGQSGKIVLDQDGEIIEDQSAEAIELFRAVLTSGMFPIRQIFVYRREPMDENEATKRAATALAAWNVGFDPNDYVHSEMAGRFDTSCDVVVAVRVEGLT